MMLNWIISSSVLILGIIGIRFLFQKKMKCKIQYALWLLVLIRLLTPFSIGHSSFSVSNTVNTISPAVMEQSTVPERPKDEAHIDQPSVRPVESAAQNSMVENLPENPVTEFSFLEILSDVLLGVWITGAILTGLTFLSANLTFRRRLKISRHILPAYACKLNVYVTNRIQSPCLFGLFHPAIYLTRQVMGDENMIRHTVAHEFTHYRHGDHVWAILRGLCLTIHWYNPLVWWAAILSQRDAELACDEDTIKVLGEGERKAYGMTLIHVSCQKNTHLLTAATTMTADKKVLRQRIQTIARKRKNVALAVTAVSLLTAVFVGCTFSGAAKAEREDQPLPVETTLPTGQIIREDMLLDEILSGTGSFYSTDFKKNMTLGEFCSTFVEGNTLTPERYALVDLDRDGTEEAVFQLYIAEDNNIGTLILHQSGAQYMGYSRYYRQMNHIKEDGTFSWSGGGAYDGFARVTRFSPDDMVEENITWADDTEGLTDYYVNGEKAEKSQYRDAVEEEESKTDVKWTEYSPMPIDPNIADNEEKQDKVLTYMQNGTLQDTPANQHSDTGYSLLYPATGWSVTDDDGSFVLRSEDEKDAWIEIRNLGNISFSKAQTLFHNSEYDLLEDARGGLSGTDHTGEKYQQIFFYPAEEGTYAVRYVFPMAQWEGIGYEIMAICDSFRVLHPSQTDVVTYFSHREEGMYPVSWISGGVQQLSGDMGPYSLWEDSLMSGAPAPENLAPVEQNRHNRGELHLYSNGNWDFFPDSVQVQSYEPGEVTWDSPWYPYFYEKLGSYDSYSPIIIERVKTFTWNGHQAELVTASNLIAANLENTEDSGAEYFDPPGNKGPSVYTFVTLFLDGKPACDLYESCYLISSEQPGVEPEILYEAKEGYIPYMTIWQYNLEGTLIEVPLYVNDTGLHSLLPHASEISSLISDLDGDGSSEILFCTNGYSSLYSNYQVYDMDNGEVSVNLSVGMG